VNRHFLSREGCIESSRVGDVRLSEFRGAFRRTIDQVKRQNAMTPSSQTPDGASADASGGARDHDTTRLHGDPY
jgi:hypothetical protein